MRPRVFLETERMQLFSTRLPSVGNHRRWSIPHHAVCLPHNRQPPTALSHCRQVARILTAVPQPNSEKLLKMSADLGGGDTRQIMVRGSFVIWSRNGNSKGASGRSTAP